MEPTHWLLLLTILPVGILAVPIIAILYTINLHHNKARLKTSTYKWSAICIIGILWCAVLELLTILLNFIEPLMEYCHHLAFSSPFIYLLSKTLISLISLIRLYYLCNNAITHYNRTIFNGTRLIMVIYGISIWILTLYFVDELRYNHGNNYVVCQSVMEQVPESLIAVLFRLFGLIFSFGFVFIFIGPVRKLIKSVIVSGISWQNKDGLTPEVKAGVKHSILTTIAALSTLMMLMIFATGYTIFQPIDFIINMIVILLVTPYYLEQSYSDGLCCGAMSYIRDSRCCDGYQENGLELMTTNDGSRIIIEQVININE